MESGQFSNRVQDVIRLSREEALRLGHDYIGTEHLLLGIIREGEGIAGPQNSVIGDVAAPKCGSVFSRQQI